jgi:Cu(I)/Ag(I) efflux system membrane protein CusA/SilA
MLRSENARLSGWVYVDVRGRDLRSVGDGHAGGVAREVALPPATRSRGPGQFEYLERATERLKLVVPRRWPSSSCCCTCCSARAATRRW